MDYALAKELKDAGFPQIRSTVPVDLKHLRTLGYFIGDGENDSESVYVPTLTELIAACGSIALCGFGDHWSAYDAEWPDSGYSHSSEGSTPDEAVARLWLALNKRT